MSSQNSTFSKPKSTWSEWVPDIPDMSWAQYILVGCILTVGGLLIAVVETFIPGSAWVSGLAISKTGVTLAAASSAAFWTRRKIHGDV